MKAFLTVLFFFLITAQPAGAISLAQIADDFKATLTDTDAGASTEQTFGFGRVRLLACPGGLRDTRTVATGLLFTLTNGWTLQHPTIQAFADTAHVTRLTPLRHTPGEPWGNNYRDTAFFPILFTFPTPPTHDTPLAVIATVTACSRIGVCQKETILQTLTLPAVHNRPTPWCGFIQNALSTSAVPADTQNVIGQAARLNDTQWQAVISFPDTVRSIHAQTMDGTPESAATVTGREARLTFPVSDLPVTPGDTIPLYLKTPDLFYQINLPVTDQPLPRPTKPFPWFTALFGGLCLFLFSPLWPVWLTNTGRTTATVRQNISASIRHLTPWVLIAAAATTSGTMQIFCALPGANIAILLLLAFFLFRPRPSIFITAAGLLILPKPFWQGAADYTHPTVLLIWFFWLCGAMLPFWLKSRASHKALSRFHAMTTATPTTYAILLRVPYIALTLWLITTLLLGTINKPTLFSTDTPVTHPTLVTITQSHCWSCAWDQAVTLNTSTARRLLKQHNIQMATADINSSAAQTLTHDLPAGTAPAYVLLLPDGRRFIWPQSLTLRRLQRFLDSSFTP